MVVVEKKIVHSDAIVKANVVNFQLLNESSALGIDLVAWEKTKVN